MATASSEDSLGMALPELGQAMAALRAPGASEDSDLSRICHAGLELLGVDRVAVWARADDTDWVCRASAARPGIPDVTGERRAYDRLRSYYESLGEDGILAVDDVQTDERVAALGDIDGRAGGPHALLEAVATADGTVMGTLCCERFRGTRAWQPRERHLVSLLGSFAALALETQRRRAAEAGWRASERQYVQLLNNLAEGVFQLDPGGRLSLANPALAAMLGYADPESLLLAYNARPQKFFRDPRNWRHLMRQLRRHGTVKDWHIDLRPAGRGERKATISAQAVFDGQGRLSHIDGTVSDITERKRIEERLRQIAYYDGVTGLLNRNGVLETLRQSDWHDRFALVLIDIDNFQTVNDSLGLEVGDLILYRLASRLTRLDSRIKAVGRSQADVFLALLGDVDAPEAEQLATQLQDHLAVPVNFGQGSVTVTATAGLTVVADGANRTQPAQRPGPEEMFRRAGVALKRAKRQDRGNLLTFTEDLDQALRQRLTTVNALGAALEEGQFEPVFQPQLTLPDHTIVAAEALVRWRQPDGRWLSPAHFIEVAEESGHIARIGDAVLHAGLAAHAAWTAQCGDRATPCLAVNVSARELSDPNFPARIRQALDAATCPPTCLELEITETAVMADMGRAQTALAELSTLGVRLAIDDFGTGYSSLAYLNDLAVDKVKIDRSFVTDLEAHPRARSIVGTIVTLGHDLGLEVVAEGIETQGQLTTMESLGATAVQGFYFARPLAPADFLDRLPGTGA